MVSVSGRKRVPKPPTSTTARISRLWWLLRRTVALRGARLAALMAPVEPSWYRRRGQRRGAGDHGATIGRSKRGQLRSPVGLRDVGALGHEGDREDHAIVGDADVLHVRDDVVERVGVVVVIPDTGDQLRVLAVALGVLGRPLVATLLGRHDEFGVGELDVVRVEEHPELGAVARRLRRRRVVVDDAVVVAVDAEDLELVVQQHGVALGVDTGLFQRAGDLRLERVADVDAERLVPVRIDVGAVVDAGTPTPLLGRLSRP